jgi:gas vesicle protein
LYFKVLICDKIGMAQGPAVLVDGGNQEVIEMKRVAYFAGISLAAAAAGAGVALLFAPQSGARTRRQIRHKADNYVHDLGDSLAATAHEIGGEAQRFSRSVGRRLKPAIVA